MWFGRPRRSVKIWRSAHLDLLNRLLEPHARVRVARPGWPDSEGRCVLYWIQRSQRGRDNAALNLAIALGNALGLPVAAVFGLTGDYPGAQSRHYRFLIEGLVDAAADLEGRGVPFCLGLGRPDRVLMEYAQALRPAIVIGDENPVRPGVFWRDQAAKELAVPLRFVDSDVVVPSSLFPNEEYAARTLRPKIHRVLGDYLKPIPNPAARIPFTGPLPAGPALEVDALMDSLNVGGAAAVPGYHGGAREAERRLKRFVDSRLVRYAAERNQPTPYMTSELSAHLHFGHVNPLSIALAVQSSGAPQESIDVFLEELIVRRELAINFTARNPRHDELAGCPDWALKTLAAHADDPRPYLYSQAQFEDAATHDPVWNAAQKEMTLTGRMHNYLRMYWAKKILEWTPDAATAHAIALDLNDRYEMDGRDPNGYTGVAWAIGGKHDRPWPERPIFGTVRYMNEAGIRRKLDCEAYIERVRALG